MTAKEGELIGEKFKVRSSFVAKICQRWNVDHAAPFPMIRDHFQSASTAELYRLVLHFLAALPSEPLSFLLAAPNEIIICV